MDLCKRCGTHHRAHDGCADRISRFGVRGGVIAAALLMGCGSQQVTESKPDAGPTTEEGDTAEPEDTSPPPERPDPGPQPMYGVSPVRNP